MARTKLSLLKQVAAKKALVAEKLRQDLRLRFKKGVTLVINLQRWTVGNFLSRGRVRKLCGCVVSRPDPKRFIDYTPNTRGEYSSSSGRRFCRKHLKKFLKAQKR